MAGCWRIALLPAVVLLLAVAFPGCCIASNESHERRSIHAVRRSQFTAGSWKKAHATFYEGNTNSFGGACNYKDVVGEGYGTKTAALSSALFQDGKSCGACFEIQCIDNPEGCKPGQPSLIVTATDFCPPNPSLPNDKGGWCNPPREHFDIAKPAFGEIAEVPCSKQGGIRLTITGNPYFYQVKLSNVGGAGDVVGVEVRGHDKLQNWTEMEHDWGATWKTSAILQNESLTFRVKTSDNRSITLKDVAPQSWQFGKTYEGAGANF
ncbi:hypothetical protein Tsubulata_050237 [Turnera subulata]|uniref:Expansin n=1 Tax=Turnera subulata TaxID=218843 RepID=A0A9Q0FX80_9ROSI|nr:hypothetical protein Tsubulata_050237 [Turnera subulata]